MCRDEYRYDQKHYIKQEHVVTVYHFLINWISFLTKFILGVLLIIKIWERIFLKNVIFKISKIDYEVSKKFDYKQL